MTPRLDLPLLPMAGKTHGNRSAVTCHLRCGDACSIAAPNTTETSYFRDVAATALNRRTVVGTGLTVAALTAVNASPLAAAAAEGPKPGKGGHGAPGTLPFTAIAAVPTTVDDVTVPAGYRWDPILRWGDPILAVRPPSTATTRRPRRRPASSATTTTTSTSSRPTAPARARCSCATTSTPTRTSCSRPAPPPRR